MVVSAIALNGIQNEIHRMMEMARENIGRSFDAVLEGETGNFGRSGKNGRIILISSIKRSPNIFLR